MEETVVQDSVQAEVAPQEPQTSHEQPIEEVKPDADKKQRDNWKALRERQRETERELKLQREMNEKLLALVSQASPKPQEVDEFAALQSTDVLDKGQLERLVEKRAQTIARNIAAEEVTKAMQQRQNSEYMERLRAKYRDFDDVVNPETLSLLEETEPELANTIAELKDPYKIGIQSYKYIKASKLIDKVPEANQSKEVERKLQKNAETVQSPVAFNKRPMAQAFKVTDAEKKQLLKEMYEYSRMESSVPYIQ